jgi:hypothetical protein
VAVSGEVGKVIAMSSRVAAVVPVFSISAVRKVVPPLGPGKQAPPVLSVEERDLMRRFCVGTGIGAREPNTPVSVCFMFVPPLFM